MKLIANSILALVSLSFGAVSIAMDNHYIGVIEETVRCPGNKSETNVRVLFEQKGRAWVDIREPRPGLDEFNWSIAADTGRNFVVRITDPNPQTTYKNTWFYQRDKVFKLAKSLDIGRKLNVGRNFGTWCGYPKFAPLTITSSNQGGNTKGWKAFIAGIEEKNLLYPYLKVSIGKTNAFRCDYDQTPSTVPYNFEADELVIHKSLIRGDQKLISIGLNTSLLNCDGPSLPEWSGNWFLVVNESVEFLGNELEYLDSGDFDSDGSEEILFWHSGYNRDGYVLFFNNFQQQTRYVWGYH